MRRADARPRIRLGSAGWHWLIRDKHHLDDQPARADEEMPDPSGRGAPLTGNP
jgi:hypothetical protein